MVAFTTFIAPSDNKLVKMKIDSFSVTELLNMGFVREGKYDYILVLRWLIGLLTNDFYEMKSVT